MTPVMQMAPIGLIWAVSVSIVILVAMYAFCYVVDHAERKTAKEEDDGRSDGDRPEIEAIGTTD